MKPLWNYLVFRTIVVRHRSHRAFTRAFFWGWIILIAWLIASIIDFNTGQP